MKNNRFVISSIFLAVFFLILQNSCSKKSDHVPNPPGSANNTREIGIGAMSYSPSPVTVTKGTLVKWTNNDGAQHTVTSNDGSTFSSGTIDPGGIYSYKADSVGTFNYHCTIHGLSMSGILNVSP